MSDPVTNLDTQDVLSSIRRLIADGGSGAPTLHARPPILVLTPDLRVDPVKQAARPPVSGGVAMPPAHTGTRGPDPTLRRPVPVTQTAETSVAQRATQLATIAEVRAALGVAPSDDEPVGRATAPDIDAQSDATPAVGDAQLRQIVRDVLRDELQGPTGARVTQNLRKMVRREIRLILDGQTPD